MKRSAWLVCGLMVLALGAAQAMAQDDAPARPGRDRAGRERPGRGERGMRDRGFGMMNVERMAEVLDLTEKQQEQIKEKMEAGRKAMQQWREENGEKLREARQAMREARESGDEAAQTEAREKMTALMEEMAKARAKTQQDVLSVLTDKQKLKWTEHQLINRLRMRLRFARLELTEEQNAKIKKLAGKPAREIVKLKEDVEAKTREIQQKFFEKVRDEVLTAEQKEKLESAGPRRGEGRGDAAGRRGGRGRGEGRGDTPAGRDRPGRNRRGGRGRGDDAPADD